MTRRICAVLSAACIAILGSGTASWAGQGHDKPAVCHPTGKGWVVIKPAQASSHIDEATGAPKHEHSGRVDQYAVNGACPTIPTSTPTGGTPSNTSSPSPSSTTSVPSTSTTSTGSSTTTTQQPVSTTHSSSPTTRTSRPGTGSPTPSTGTTTSSRPSASMPTPSLHSHPTSAPSTTSTLAATGSSLGGVIVAAFLLTVGLLVLAFYRVLGRREGGHR